MKICSVLVLMALAFSFISAERVIVGIPSIEVQERSGPEDLYRSVSNLVSQGYGILYYNDHYVLAITPEEPTPLISSAIELADYPPEKRLILVNKPPLGTNILPAEAGQVLLDMGSSFLLESDLNPEQLGALTRKPVTEMDLQPMRFVNRPTLPQFAGGYRTDIAQLVAAVSADSVQARLQSLEDFQTRYARAGNRLQVAQWIQQQFLDFGITDTQLQAFTYDGTDQYNVVATIPGTVNPDEYIVIGGHHDSISNNSDPYILAPGADDNASGTVATLEVARVLKQNGYQPPVSIRFVTFACEELGLWGSRHYAQDAVDTAQNIRLMINADMIATNTAETERPVRLMRYEGALDYAAYALQLTEQYTNLAPYYGTVNSGGTDSYPFWAQGFDALFFHEAEFSPVYHSSDDTVANLDPDYCAEVVRASLACAVFFADIPGSPEDPPAHDATQVMPDGFTANWETVAHADGYLLDVYTRESTGPSSDLFFSEYIEGSGNNKALEIFNGTGADVDLSDYTVRNFVGAATDPTYSLQLTGVLQDGDVYVIAHTGANAEIQAISDVRSNVAWFDGDDQLALFRESTNSYVDIIGRIGEDPGTGWGTYPYTTLNRTLVRKSAVTGGITANPTSGFPTLATEWDSYPTNTTSFLGYHAMFDISFVPGCQELEVGDTDSWPVSGLVPERTYYYVVRAANDYFTSDCSNEVSVETLADESLPVELASFTAILSAQNMVDLVWTVQSETGMQGYYVMRGTQHQLDGAILISPMINATNSSQEHSYEFTDVELYASGTYYYWLQSLDLEGNGAYHGPVSVCYDASEGSPEPDIPAVTQLKAIYPNPFNPVAFIPFSLAEPAAVRIRIHNSRGQIVRDFLLGNKEPGLYRISWDGKGHQGRELASGIYCVKMTAGRQSFQRRALLLK